MYLISCLLIFSDSLFSFNKSSLLIPKVLHKLSNVYPLGSIPDSILCIVLTGMGSDGLEGVKALKKNNSVCLTQSKKTCAVYGMPRVVEEAGLSNESVDVENIHKRIQSLSKLTIGE